MQKELILCHFNGLHIEEIYKSIPKSDKWAKQTVRLHNADIVAQHGNSESEFWFLEERIKSRSVIITFTADGDIIKDDPDVLKMLGRDSKGQANKGSAQNRGSLEDNNKKSGYEC
jgi:hypothetical protein